MVLVLDHDRLPTSRVLPGLVSAVSQTQSYSEINALLAFS